MMQTIPDIQIFEAHPLFRGGHASSRSTSYGLPGPCCRGNATGAIGATAGGP